MQGIGLQFDNNSIAKLKKDYDKIISDLENRKINIDFKDINKNINELTSKMRELQNINLKNNTLDIGKQFKDKAKDINEVVNAYRELGKVDVVSKVFDKDTKELESFTIQLEKANGIVDKFAYKWKEAKEIQNVDGSKSLIPEGFYLNSNITEKDNTSKILEQQIKDNQKLADNIGKVREQIELKTKAEEKANQIKQANESNKAKEEAYYSEQNRQQYLNTLGKNITPNGFNFDLSKSTYTDMERLAKEIGGVNAEIKKIDVQPLAKGDEVVRKVTYRVKEGKDKWHEYQLAVTENAQTGEKSLRQLDNGTKDVINRQVGLLGRLKNAWIAVFSFSGVTGVFYEMVHSVKDAINMTIDLDKAMTNIQMISGKSRTEVQGLMGDYNKLATELHTTTKEMADGAENFLRAGKSVEQTRNLLKATTIGSAISGQSNNQTSEQLIAISNGFKLNTDNAKELMGVIDKLSAVDNSSATSFAKILAFNIEIY